MVVSDSSNNRLLVLDASTHIYIEQIGTGKSGYRDGAFSEARFALPQGMCHYVNNDS